VIFDLAQDLAEALAAMPRGQPRRRILSLLEEAIRRDGTFLARHPTALFQCLWNSCWWHDCPEAAEHYHPPAESWSSDGPPWQRAGAKLHQWMETWRQHKERAGGFLWVRSLRPPPVPLGGALRAICTGHETRVGSLNWTADGSVLASGSADCTIRLWERFSGRELACLHGHEGAVTALTWTADGLVLASASEDRTVRLWERHSGYELACLRGHEKDVLAVSWAGDGRVLASGARDGTVRLWERDSGRELTCLRGHEADVTALSWTKDGRVLASGSYDDTVRLWERDSGRELACLRGHEGFVSALDWTGDDRVLASGSADGTVRLWERQQARDGLPPRA
jgi:WD40 repeat protein